MRVFVAGATGVIGRALLRQLRDARHEVTGMTRSSRSSAMPSTPTGSPALWLPHGPTW